MKLSSEDIDPAAKEKIQEILNYFKDPKKSLVVGYKMRDLKMGSDDNPTGEDLK